MSITQDEIFLLSKLRKMQDVWGKFGSCNTNLLENKSTLSNAKEAAS